MLMNSAWGRWPGGGEDEVLARIPAALGGDGLVPVVEPGTEVVTGAERPSCAPEHDDLDRVVPDGGRHGRFELVGHRGHDGVQAIGAVEGDRGHLVGDGVQQRLVGHRCSLA